MNFEDSTTHCPSDDVLLDYTAGQLDPNKAVLFDRHADSCARCSALRSAQAAVWRSLDEWKPEPVGAGFNRELWRRIDAEAQTSSWWHRFSETMQLSLWRRAAPLAVAMALVVTAFVLDHAASMPVKTQAGTTAVVVTVSDADELEQTLDDIQLLHAVDTTSAAVKAPTGVM